MLIYFWEWYIYKNESEWAEGEMMASDFRQVGLVYHLLHIQFPLSSEMLDHSLRHLDIEIKYLLLSQPHFDAVSIIK